MTTTTTTKQPETRLVRAHGVRPDGSFGVRGFRVHCDCSYLSEVVPNYQTAEREAMAHRREHRSAA